MKTSLTTTFSSLMLASMLFTAGIVSTGMVSSINKSVEPRKNQIAMDRHRWAQNYFAGTVSEISDVVQTFANETSTRHAIIDKEERLASKLLLNMNSQSFPFSASVLYLTRGDKNVWIESHKFIDGLSSVQIIDDIESVDANVHHRIIPNYDEDISTPIFVHSSKINHIENFSSIGSVRAAFNIGQGSEFIKELQKRMGAQCVVIALLSDPNVKGAIGPNNCISKIQTQKNDVNIGNSLTSYFIDSDELFVQGALSESVRFKDAVIKSIIQTDIIVAHKDQLWRTLILLALSFLISGFLAWLFSKWYIQTNIRKLVELVAHAPNVPIVDNYENDIIEFQLVGDTYQNMRYGLIKETSKKEVAQNNVEKLNNKLKNAHLQKMEALGTLTASVAHDFNNILAIIRGNLDLIDLDNQLPSGVNDSINVISHSTDRASGIVKNLMLYIRNDPKLKRTHDLADEIKKFAAILPSVLGPEITFSIEIDERHDYQVVMDADKCGSSLMNLTINARDAMKQGGTITIRLELDPEDPTGQTCLLSFEDTGSGISSDILHSVFDPFFTTKGIGSGTGLGLSIVHEFAENSRGNVELKSELGQGTTFEIRLPIEAAAPKEPAPKSVNRKSLAGINILVVDDEIRIRSFLKTLLKREHANVNCVASVDEANEAIESSCEIECLITDMHLTDGSGEKIISKLQSLRSNVPVIVISGYNIEVDELIKSTGSKNITILQKPFSSKNLLKTIGEVLFV